jgi:hypothetical protein
VQEKLERRKRERGRTEDQQTNFGDRDRAELDDGYRARGQDRPIGVAPHHVGEVLQNEPEAKHQEKGGQRGLVGLGKTADQEPVDTHAEEKKEGQREQGTDNRIEVQSIEDFVNEVGAEHDDARVREIHDFHHAIDHRHPHRHDGIDSGEQHRGNEQIEEVDRRHEATTDSAR